MSKKSTNLCSGFLISYDWLPALESLSAEDFHSLLFALIKRQRDGEPLPVFSSPVVGIYARMIEPTIKRRLDGQSGGNKSVGTTQDTTVGTTVGTTQDTTVGSKVKKSKVEKSKVEKSTYPPNPPKGAEVYSERFCIFWKEYPKKVGKAAAEKAFIKLKPSEEMLQQMLEAIKAQKQSEQWARDGGQFIPHPATWLNRGQWDDEITAPQNRKADIPLDEFFS